ncbi:MAG TPA: alpha/beta fold hydrolase [Gammaproteobacteria bacterium]|nr:alpha/beta fold hydrolase [Gammaproteobacteria bacterium]
MTTLLTLGLCCVALIGALYAMQESLLFYPEKLPRDYRFSVPDAVEVEIPVDGAVLSALHLRLPDPRGLVFFLHGNAGSLRSWFSNSEFYRRVNYDLFMIDYRGYGKSTGSIESEAQLNADVRKAWDVIAPRYAGKKIIIYGRSLGTGLAAKLASEVNATMLILVSPYSSLRELACSYYPFVPGALIKYPLRTDLLLPRIKMPVLLIHGAEDEVIPYAHSVALKALAPDVELIRIEGAHHNDIHEFPAYVDLLARRLQQL